MGTVVFDLDGTLADTSGDLIAAANAVFRADGHGDLLDPAGDSLTAFSGGRAMLRLGYGRIGRADVEDRIDDHYARFLGIYGDMIDVHTRLYPGAMEAVDALKAAGYRVAVCTNKPEALARVLLDRLGVLGVFGSLVGADTLPVRKPDAAPFRASVERAGGDPAHAVLVGDTITDRDTARAAGVPCILVSFGPLGPKGAAALSPTALLADYGALPGLVSGLLPLRGAA